MGMHQIAVHPLSLHDDSTVTNSGVYDIGDSVEVHGLLKVTDTSGTSPTLDIKAQHSIDGVQWSDLTGLSFTQATGATVETKSATANAFRYLRFRYTLGGTSPTATFELEGFVKTRS